MRRGQVIFRDADNFGVADGRCDDQLSAGRDGAVCVGPFSRVLSVEGVDEVFDGGGGGCDG